MHGIEGGGKILLVQPVLNRLGEAGRHLTASHPSILATHPEEALTALRDQSPWVALVDLDGADGTRGGDSLSRMLLAADPRLKVIVTTSRECPDEALDAVTSGAFDFLHLPASSDQVLALVRRAFYTRALEEENEALGFLLTRGHALDAVLGTCPAMETALRTVRGAADTEASILIQGETGTGKKLLAKTIHALSQRRGKPFLTINCGAMPEHLLGQELFGPEPSGIRGSRRGKIRLAFGGTVLLEDADQLPSGQQTRLSRLLSGPAEGSGTGPEAPPNVRIIASTSRELGTLARDGVFDPDLHRCLSAVTVSLPALRDRGDDVVLLARSFLQRFSGEMRKEISDFAADAHVSITSHAWPGNVRELENRVKRGVIICRESRLSSGDLGLHAFNHGLRLTLKEARRQLDVSFIRHALQRTGGNISQAARELGITRVCLHDLLNRYALRPVRPAAAAPAMSRLAGNAR